VLHRSRRPGAFAPCVPSPLPAPASPSPRPVPFLNDMTFNETISMICRCVCVCVRHPHAGGRHVETLAARALLFQPIVPTDREREKGRNRAADTSCSPLVPRKLRSRGNLNAGLCRLESRHEHPRYESSCALRLIQRHRQIQYPPPRPRPQYRGTRISRKLRESTAPSVPVIDYR